MARVALAIGGAIGLLVVSVAPVAAQQYTVQSGDSLSIIARDHGVTTAELAAANGISNLHLIRVGQVLTIPGLVYEVRSGDSLSVIAARTGVSTSAIAAVNGITNPNLIRVGQELRIPAGGSAPAPADPAAGYDNLPGRLRENPGRLQLIPSFEKWSVHYGVPTDLLMAMAYRESGWQTSVVSPKGAVGVGQLMPATSEWIADHLIGADLDPNDPDDNIRMSARFLNWLVGYMGSEEAAIAGYYQGPNSVRAIGYYDDTQAYITNIAQIRRFFVRS
ncbi:MAG: LysM peptidoglycan-binding domain-containing protein [Actinomycetota bacterium]